MASPECPNDTVPYEGTCHAQHHSILPLLRPALGGCSPLLCRGGCCGLWLLLLRLRHDPLQQLLQDGGQRGGLLQLGRLLGQHLQGGRQQLLLDWGLLRLQRLRQLRLLLQHDHEHGLRVELLLGGGTGRSTASRRRGLLLLLLRHRLRLLLPLLHESGLLLLLLLGRKLLRLLLLGVLRGHAVVGRGRRVLLLLGGLSLLGLAPTWLALRGLALLALGLLILLLLRWW